MTTVQTMRNRIQFYLLTVGLPLVLVCGAAWVTHVVNTIAAEAYLFLIAGAVFAPVGVIHGIGLWFGAW